MLELSLISDNVTSRIFVLIETTSIRTNVVKPHGRLVLVGYSHDVLNPARVPL